MTTSGGSKTYSVSYNITANLGNTVTNLQTLAEKAEATAVNMKAISDAAAATANNIRQLSELSRTPISVAIDPRVFNAQMEQMVVAAEAAAQKIHAILNGALQGNTSGKMPGFTTYRRKTLDELKKDNDAIKSQIKETEQRVKGYKNAIKKGVADPSYHTQLVQQQNRLANLKQYSQWYEDEIKATEARAAALNKANEKVTKATAKNAKAIQAATTSASTGGNKVPVDTVKELTKAMQKWNNAFGSGRKSIAISVNAKNFYRSLTRIKDGLNSLPTEKTINIVPILSSEAYNVAKEQLNSLAKISSKIARPHGASSMSNEEKALLDKRAALTKRIDGLKAIKSPTPSQKGLLTKAEKELVKVNGQLKPGTGVVSGAKAASNSKPVDLVGKVTSISNTKPIEIPAIAKLNAAQIEASFKAIPIQTINARVHLILDNIPQQLQAIKAGQAKGTVSKAGAGGTQSAGMNTSGNAGGQGASGSTYMASMSGAAGKNGTPYKGAKSGSWPQVTPRQYGTSSLQPSVPFPGTEGYQPSTTVTPSIPTVTGASSPTMSRTPKNATAAQAYKKQRENAEKNYKKQRLDQRFRANKAQEYATQQNTWYTQQQKMYNHLFRDVPTNYKSNVNWYTEQEKIRRTQLSAMRADAMAAFAKPTPFEMNERQQQVAKSIAHHRQLATSKATSLRNSLLPHVANESQLKTVLQNRRYFREAMSASGINPMSPNLTASQKLQYLNTTADRMRTNNAPIPWQLQDQINKLSAQQRQAQAANTAAQKAMGAPSGFVGSGKNQVYFGNKMPAATLAPQGMKWTANNNLLGSLKPEQRVGYNEALKRVRGSAIEKRSTKAVLDKRQSLHSRALALQQSLAPVKELQKQIQAAQAQIAHDQKALSKLPSHAGQRRSALQSRIAAYSEEQTRLTESLGQRKWADRASRRLPGAISNAQVRYAAAEQSYNSSVADARAYQRGYSLMPIAPPAAPVPAAPAPAAPKVPNTPKAAAPKAAPVRRTAAPVRGYRPAPYDAFRKWSYPFTGGTSFGTRTPMAVDMAKGMGVMFAIGGAMSAISNSFGQAMEYQNTMQSTKSILRNGSSTYKKSEFEEMEHIVRNVGIKTKFSAPEVASAAKFLAMAGYDIQGINQAIRPVADLALIGGTELGETADKVTNIMTTFGVDAAKLKEDPDIVRKFANIMTSTAVSSNTDVMMLAESAKYGGGIANLYGRNDPNLFADTMAIYGMMGNAGIQGSAAGTALRMMYMNLFNPNKKQAAEQKRLLDRYQLTTKNEDGSNRSMAEVIMDIANKVPEAEMADVVSKLFRITAQAGSAAALFSAQGMDAESAAKAEEEWKKIEGSKIGLSNLARLMFSNREAANGNISGNIAGDMQNTLSGLWAQVTSTFTEGIVKAFEERQGGFAQMLISLRDYLAKPETVKMLADLLDLVIEVGKMLAEFAKIWADIYHLFPGVIGWWIKMQMVFTQVGYLIAPLTGLFMAFGRLSSAIQFLTGVSLTGAGSITGMATRTAAAGGVNAVTGLTNAAMMAPMMVTGPNGKPTTVKGKTASRVRLNQAKSIAKYTRGYNGWQNASTGLMMASMLVPGSTPNTPMMKPMLPVLPQSAGQAMIGNTIPMMAAQNRATEITLKAQEKYRKKYLRPDLRLIKNFAKTWTARPTMFSAKNMMAGLTTIAGSFASLIALLVHPITLSIAAFAALGVGIWALVKRINGTTDAQIAMQKKTAEIAEQGRVAMAKNGQWYAERQKENNKIVGQTKSSTNTKAIKEYDERVKQMKEKYPQLTEALSKNASAQSIKALQEKWQSGIMSTPHYRYALNGPNKGKAGSLPSDAFSGFEDTKTSLNWINGSALAVEHLANPTATLALKGYHIYDLIRNLWTRDERKMDFYQNNMIKQALALEGGDSNVAQEATKKVQDLKKRQLAGKISEEEYNEGVAAIRANAQRQLAGANLAADKITPENFAQINPADYVNYQLGALNVIDAEIRGENGTITAQMIAQKTLAENLKNKTAEQADKWYQAVWAAMSGRQQVINYLDKNGQQASAAVTLGLDNKGALSFNKIASQIRTITDQFTITLQSFADLVAGTYKAMADAGLTDGSRSSMLSATQEATKHMHLTDETVRQYYKTHIAKNAQWKGWTEDMYVKAVTDKSRKGVGKVLGRSDGSWTNSAKERDMIRKNTAKDAVNAQYSTLQELTKTAEELGGGGKGAGGNTSSPVNQNDYKPSSDSSMAAPKHITMNNNFNFSDIKIGSTAEERDIMQAIEWKLGPALSQMVAQCMQA